MTDAPWPTIAELAGAVRRGERSAVATTTDALDRIAERDRFNAFVAVEPALALAAAARVDEAIGRGEDPGPLAGVPFGVKDLEDCAGYTTSHGSLLYRDADPATHDSIHVARLRAAGAIPLGKTASPEFGTLNFTKTKAFGVTTNPWDETVTPGGSSGGSAAAVAAGLVPFATGSDGGGSIRIPAAFSGLVGHKCSHGRIPDPVPDGSLTAVLGSLTTTVTDAALLLDVVAGPDAHDRISLPAPGVRYEQAVERLDVDGLRARWSGDLGFAAVDPEVEDLARAAAERLVEVAGLRVDEEPIRLTDPVRAWLSAGSLDLWFHVSEDQLRDRADDLTAYTRFSLDETVGTRAPKVARAQQRRLQLQVEVGDLFDDVDVVLCPTTAISAFAAAGPPHAVVDGHEVSGAMATPFTMLANLCWNPSISIPAGVTASGLPVGLMITARQHRDDICLRLARLLELAQPWPRWAPGA